MPATAEQLNLWRHGQKVGMLCEHLALAAPDLAVARGDAYLAGLLHDIGRFVMFEHAWRKLEQIEQTHWHSPEDLIRADKDVFKFTHSELGFVACTHWGLPSHLAQVVRQHHSALPEEIEPGSLDALNLCVQIADRVDIRVLARDDLAGLPLEERTQMIEQECLAPLNAVGLVDAARLAGQLPDVNRKCRDMVAALGIA